MTTDPTATAARPPCSYGPCQMRARFQVGDYDMACSRHLAWMVEHNTGKGDDPPFWVKVARA